MRRRPRLSRDHIQARASVRTAIGRMLAAQYDLAEPLPAPLATLMGRLEQTDANGGEGARRAEHDERAP
jgi:hypothetical protein